MRAMSGICPYIIPRGTVTHQCHSSNVSLSNETWRVADHFHHHHHHHHRTSVGAKPGWYFGSDHDHEYGFYGGEFTDDPRRRSGGGSRRGRSRRTFPGCDDARGAPTRRPMVPHFHYREKYGGGGNKGGQRSPNGVTIGSLIQLLVQ